MRNKTGIFFAIAAFLFCSLASAQQTAKVTSSGIWYLEYLPQGYNSNTNKYPVVISLHGIKEKGNTGTDVARVANVGLPKYVKYGQQYPFILISPQLKTSHGTWPPSYVLEVINYVKTKLRIDPNRIYLTGLSLGGFGVWKTAAQYPEVFASILPICAGGNALTQACNIAKENLPTWTFHGDKDGVVSYQVSLKMINAINACTPKPSPLAKFTMFPGMGHVIWDKVYKETTALNWMLGFTKNGSTSSDGGTSATSTNATPTVSAGADKTLTLPTNTIALQGTASDTDGSIATWQWTKISGSTASLANASTSKVTVSSLVAGTYTFRLTVKDNDGATKYDDVKVTVSTTTTTNAIPTVTAGSDKTITLPSNTVYLSGSASDTDGSIASYQWTKISGSTASLANATTKTLKAYNLVAGTYTFRLTVKDDKGATKYDDVKVTVKTATTTTANVAPKANAGTDKSITVNNTKLYGSGTDSDGVVKYYKWSRVSGPACYMYNVSKPTLDLSNMPKGTYYFKLTVTDDDGAVGTDQVQVVVGG